MTREFNWVLQRMQSEFVCNPGPHTPSRNNHFMELLSKQGVSVAASIPGALIISIFFFVAKT